MPALRQPWGVVSPASMSARMSRRIEAMRPGPGRFRMGRSLALCELYDSHYGWTSLFWGQAKPCIPRRGFAPPPPSPFRRSIGRKAMEPPMIRTLRTRLFIGIAPLLAIVIGLGLWGVVMFYRLGGKIDVILRENYRSVLYAQNMKESLERMDSALLFAIGGEEQQARDQFAEYRPVLAKELAGERRNITLPGEREMVAR